MKKAFIITIKTFYIRFEWGNINRIRERRRLSCFKCIWHTRYPSMDLQANLWCVAKVTISMLRHVTRQNIQHSSKKGWMMNLNYKQLFEYMRTQTKWNRLNVKHLNLFNGNVWRDIIRHHIFIDSVIKSTLEMRPWILKLCHVFII